MGNEERIGGEEGGQKPEDFVASETELVSDEKKQELINRFREIFDKRKVENQESELSETEKEQKMREIFKPIANVLNFLNESSALVTDYGDGTIHQEQIDVKETEASMHREHEYYNIWVEDLMQEEKQEEIGRRVLPNYAIIVKYLNHDSDYHSSGSDEFDPKSSQYVFDSQDVDAALDCYITEISRIENIKLKS